MAFLTTIKHTCGHKYEHRLMHSRDSLIAAFVREQVVKDCPACLGYKRMKSINQVHHNMQEVTGKYIVMTQADLSKWAINLEKILAIYQDEFEIDNGYIPVYGATFGLNDLLVFAQSLKWAEVVNFATMIAPSPDGGPDYNWGWQHGDAEIQEITLPEPIDDSEERLNEIAMQHLDAAANEQLDYDPYVYESDEQEQVERADNAWDDEPYTYHGAYDLDYE